MNSIPTAIYARFSTDRQDARSIVDQVRRCRRFAEERGWQVVEVYSDSAVSGAHLHRPGIRRLLEAARSRARPFRTVLVDDLSRLSRDLGGFWRTVYEDLASVEVTVVDCSTGRASDEAGSRLTFGVTALMNDQFLEMVRTETHRGLEGRALAGFHTGGRCYGYETYEEPHPADPEHPRRPLRINKEEARLVRRIFKAFAAGTSPGTIAEGLNAEGMPAPYDGAYQKLGGRGWGYGTVRAMLRNERYLGRVVWNQRVWKRHPVTGKRRSQLRPEAEWVRVERPELRIIDDVLWARVASRFGDRRQLGTPRAKKPSPLSGLLRCGVCNSRMVLDIGTRGHRNFQCAANKTKGSAICPNAKRVSEHKVLSAFIETVKESLAHPQFRERFEATFKRLFAEAVRPSTGESEGERRLRAQEAKVAKLAAAVDDYADIESLVSRLRAEEATLRDLRQRAATAPAPRRVAPPYPTPGQLSTLWADVEGTLQATPQEAKEVLAARFEPVMLTPHEEAWTMETAMRVGAVVDLKGLGPATLASGRAEMWPNDGCGGRI